MLRIYAELPFAQVAKALKISENSAKVIYCRAKKMLAEELKNEFEL
jgi:RNA polymerase sigma-70 factor (ECF subfamily)